MTDNIKHICPACGFEIKDFADNNFKCPSCKSLFQITSHNDIRLIKSGIKFSVFNFLLGFFYSFFILGLGYLFFIDKMILLELGFAYLALAILLTFRILFNEIMTDQKNRVSNTIFAVFNGRLKYFDKGSKFFAFSWSLISILGICCIVIGFLKK